MTQKYYTERILPVYINAIHKARLQHANPWIFQEDNDPSHGTRKKWLAYQLKEDGRHLGGFSRRSKGCIAGGIEQDYNRGGPGTHQGNAYAM
jgi:hypothetical protein